MRSESQPPSADLAPEERIARARALVAAVKDPEIPALSIVELGMLRAARVEGPDLVVELLPTFAGCPALSLIEQEVRAALAPLAPVRVAFVYDEPWTSARITAAGRETLLAVGFAPPPPGDLLQITLLPAASCPYCGSADTRRDSPFGPTACRAIHSCRACRQPFEQFKAV